MKVYPDQNLNETLKFNLSYWEKIKKNCNNTYNSCYYILIFDLLQNKWVVVTVSIHHNQHTK